MNKRPCLKCEDRYLGCQDYCKKEEYLSFLALKKRIDEGRKDEYRRYLRTTAPVTRHGHHKKED